MTELLFILYLMMTIFSYYVFDRDLTAPPFIFCGLYTFSIIMALSNKDLWQVNISDETFMVFFCGGLIFIAFGLLFRWLWGGGEVKGIELSLIKVKSWIVWGIVCFTLVVSYLQYHAMMEIAMAIGAGTGASSLAVAAVRQVTSYGTELNMPAYLLQLNKVVFVFGYVFLFIYINNGIYQKKEWKNICYLLPVIIWVISNVSTGNRLVALSVVGASFIYYYILSSLRYGSQLDSVRILIKLIAVFLVLMIGFYSIRLLAGRVGSETYTLLQYISLYAGGPIKLFDMFLEQPVVSDLWGKETFISIHNSLRSLGLENYPAYIAHKEFRDVNGISVGNVYTAYRVWYADFGFEGIVILGSIVSAFYNGFYYKMRAMSLYQNKFTLILYGYMSSGLFLHSIDDDFFRYFATLGFVSIFILFYIGYRLINAISYNNDKETHT